jgi:hypothetical protein
MGTLLLMSPQNDFAPIALQQMDQVIVAYTSVVQTRTSPRLVQNLRWLLRLRQRALDRIAKVQNEHRETGPSTGSIDETIELDAGLLGWKTRFIERLGNHSQKATTISTSTPPGISPFNIEKVIQSMPRAVQEHVAGDTLSAPDPNFDPASNDHLLNSTDQLVSDRRCLRAKRPVAPILGSYALSAGCKWVRCRPRVKRIVGLVESIWADVITCTLWL